MLVQVLLGLLAVSNLNFSIGKKIMNKIFRFMTVLLVFSWVPTANAGSIVASFTNINGGLSIDGFRLGFPSDDGDNDPSTINFLLNYINGGTASVLQPIKRGNSYNIAVDGETSFGPINASFDIESTREFNRIGAAPIEALLGQLIPNPVFYSGSPLGALTVRGNTLDLLSITAGPSGGGYFLKLATQVTSGTALNELLDKLDENENGSLIGRFNNANLTVVPEPTTLLLLGAGLLGMFGFSKKRA